MEIKENTFDILINSDETGVCQPVRISVMAVTIRNHTFELVC